MVAVTKMYWDWIEENATNEEDSFEGMDEEGYDSGAGSDADPCSQSNTSRRKRVKRARDE